MHILDVSLCFFWKQRYGGPLKFFILYSVSLHDLFPLFSFIYFFLFWFIFQKKKKKKSKIKKRLPFYFHYSLTGVL